MTYSLIDLNYAREGLEAVLTWEDGFTEADIEQRLSRCRETEAFHRLAGMKRPLFSSDLAEFRRLANRNVEYAKNTAARPDIELPRVRQFAAEIPALIDDEYR